MPTLHGAGIRMKGGKMSCKDVNKEIMEIFDTIFRIDPMFFSRVDKGAIGIQREQMRGQMGLTDTEGMTITEENLKKLMSDLSKSRPFGCGVYLDDVFYEDFSHFCSALINKYFTKE